MLPDILIYFGEAEFGELVWFVNEKGLIKFVDI